MTPLLQDDEPAAVTVLRPDAPSPFLLLADHAGRTIPRALGTLGVDEAERARHIGWDIGIAGVTERLSAALDATAILQTYSRLVIDCNRPPGARSSIPVLSEATRIPGNEALSAEDAERRRAAIFAPYHAQIGALLDARAASGRPVVLMAMHSFTPSFLGERRPWHIGTLYGRDRRLALALLPLLRAESGLVVGDNEPYAVTDSSDYAIPVHGEGRGLVHMGLEIRQDLIAHADGQAEWAARLARLLPLAAERATSGRSET